MQLLLCYKVLIGALWALFAVLNLAMRGISFARRSTVTFPSEY